MKRLIRLSQFVLFLCIGQLRIYAQIGDLAFEQGPEPSGFEVTPQELHTKYSIEAPGITIRLDESGHIAECLVDKHRTVFPLSYAGIQLDGFSREGGVIVKRLAGKGYSFISKVSGPRQKECTVTENFIPTKNSIRWEIMIEPEPGVEELWTAPVSLSIRIDHQDAYRYWIPSTGKVVPGGKWGHPFSFKHFANKQYTYGSTGIENPDEFVSLPMASVMDSVNDLGLSLVLSPEDPLLDVLLETYVSGTSAGVKMIRSSHRFEGGKTIRFSQDIVPHQADWRGGLKWITERYPEFFDPLNARADSIAGCGAYSASEEVPDVEKMKQMAFSFNWRARFDWPYLGMSLPPVKNDEDPWRCSDVDAGGNPIPGQETYMTFRRMNDYAHRMKQAGFHVLNYFTTTEFGLAMKGIEHVDNSLTEDELWKDCTSFAYRMIRDGILPDQEGKHIYSNWGGAIVTDCGGANYKEHLLDQAKKQVERLPDYSGICIDRLDWLTQVNYKEDDQAGLYHGSIGRLVRLSWLSLMDTLHQIIHERGQVIFANPVTAYRLEVTRYLDGIYDEFGTNGANLNASAFLSLRKPLIAWTPGDGFRVQNTPDIDPDAFFQRHLIMGAYPTAPLPGNDHTILPDPETDQSYLDYGPLLKAIRGKKWVLESHCVESENPSILVNLFQVFDGYALPVTFGGKASGTRVRVKNIPGLDHMTCSADYPGEKRSHTLESRFKDGVLLIDVPLKNGCAMIRLTTKE
ncbi:MAG: hypothetical protein RBS73_00905 [Prolixibacteraceae bacterium]|nr:hypothetical protein [Prolixibacteraceae bacterium]